MATINSIGSNKPIEVAFGGTGQSTLTIHGVLLGNTTSGITALAAAATGATLMGVTGSDPAFTGSPSFSGSVTAGTTITATSGAITATSGNFVLTAATTSSVGQITQAGTPLLHTMGGITTNMFAGGSGNFTLSATSCLGIGYQALSGLSSGNGNTGICTLALGQRTVTGANNLAIGTSSLTFLTSGAQNVSIGNNSMDSGTVAGSNNTAVGYTSLRNLIGGSGNTIIGQGSGSAYVGSEGENIILGRNIAGTAAESNVTRIGNAQTKVFITGIFGITVGISGIPIVIDNANQLGTVASSIKYKENVFDMGDISDDIHKLRPVVFNYKKDKDRSMCYGLIAEDVNEMIPNIVVKNLEKEIETVKYLDLIPMLLNEVQKLRKELDKLKVS